MSIYICNNVSDNNINKAVLLHIEHLAYRSFITIFGPKLLADLYRDWIKLDNAILIISDDDGSVNGFVLGIKNKELLFEPIKLNPFKYAKHIFKTLYKKPLLIKKLFETLSYKGKSKSTVKAELLVIVTDSNNRSKGLGTSLVNQLSREFQKNDIAEYLVTVHSDMAKSNNFYLKNKMVYTDSFILYGTKWNTYKKSTIQNDENTMG